VFHGSLPITFNGAVIMPENTSDEFLLDVMYPLTLAHEMKGWFPLHTPDKWADRRNDGIEFLSGDEPELTPGTAMQSDFYVFKRRDKADESFQYACEHLRNWNNSHQGAEYLVKLTEGSITGELITHHKGEIGVS